METTEDMQRKVAIGNKIFYLAVLVIIGSFIVLGGTVGGFLYLAEDLEAVSESQIIMAIVTGVLSGGLGAVTGALFTNLLQQK